LTGKKPASCAVVALLWALAGPGGLWAPGRAAEPATAVEGESETLQALRAAVAAAPDDPQAQRRLAIALHGSKRREEALVHFERAAELAPTPRSLLDLALAYGSLSRLDDAEKTYRRLLALTPDDPIVLHNLGNIALKRGDTTEAIDLYRRALTSRPDYVLASYHLGNALRQAERDDEALAAYRHTLELEPKSAADLSARDDALYQTAALLIQRGAYDQAEPLLVQLLRVNPDHPNASYAYGQVLLQLGRTEEAQRAFAHHVEIMSRQTPSGPTAGDN